MNCSQASNGSSSSDEDVFGKWMIERSTSTDSFWFSELETAKRMETGRRRSRTSRKAYADFFRFKLKRVSGASVKCPKCGSHVPHSFVKRHMSGLHGIEWQDGRWMEKKLVSTLRRGADAKPCKLERGDIENVSAAKRCKRERGDIENVSAEKRCKRERGDSENVSAEKRCKRKRGYFQNDSDADFDVGIDLAVDHANAAGEGTEEMFRMRKAFLRF